MKIKHTKMSLKKIDYKREDGSNNGISVKDKAIIYEANIDNITLLYKRSVKLDFESKETLEICVYVDISFDDALDFSKEDPVKFVKDNCDDLLIETFAFTSSLISQITSSYGNYPFITAPGWYGKKNIEMKK